MKNRLLVPIALGLAAGTSFGQTLTNTPTSIYTAAVSPFTSTFDALIGIAVVVLGVTIVYGLAKRWLAPRSHKAG